MGKNKSLSTHVMYILGNTHFIIYNIIIIHAINEARDINIMTLITINIKIQTTIHSTHWTIYWIWIFISSWLCYYFDIFYFSFIFTPRFTFIIGANRSITSTITYFTFLIIKFIYHYISVFYLIP